MTPSPRRLAGRRAHLPANQGGQGDDPAFAPVVRPKNEYQVFQADDHDQRPEHQREDAHHVGMADRDAVFAVKTLPNGVYRAGADIPENHAQRGQGQLRQPAVGFGLSIFLLRFFRFGIFSVSV